MEVALVNGLFARLAGPKDARVLLLLHAFADSGLVFLPLMQTTLARSFRLVALDLAGFGASPRHDKVRTVSEHAAAIAGVATLLAPEAKVGLVAHSVASMIAVDVARRLGGQFGGLFSMEGNLTADDAYFSGRAAEFDDPREFKRRFLDDLWAMGQTRPVFRHYFAAAFAADPLAMWNLGRDARRLSVGDAPGRALSLIRPARYYWSFDNTTEASRQWIEQSSLDHCQFAGASHWPMVDQPDVTAQVIGEFFAGRDMADVTFSP